MTYPQCPQKKSSPPVPGSLLSVRRIERFSVVTPLTGIIGIVAILVPQHVTTWSSMDCSKMAIDQPRRAACLIFASGRSRRRDLLLDLARQRCCLCVTRLTAFSRFGGSSSPPDPRSSSAGFPGCGRARAGQTEDGAWEAVKSIRGLPGGLRKEKGVSRRTN
jgi:hypothetical protein